MLKNKKLLQTTSLVSESFILSLIISGSTKLILGRSRPYMNKGSKDFIFSHGSMNILPDKKILVGSYHPSPRNVNTGRIDKSKMVKFLNNIKKLL